MPTLNIPVIVTLLLLTACDQLTEASARNASAPSSSRFIWTRYTLTDGEPLSLTGRGGRLAAEFRGEHLRIANAEGRAISLNVIPPASILWRPDGQAAAINNGNGSGQMSHLTIVFNGRPPFALGGIEDQLKAYFINRTHCHIDPSSISIEAQGWAVRGSAIWVSFESWDRARFCSNEDVYFVQYDFSRRTVVARLSLDETMARYCQDPSFRQLFGPNCLQYERRSRTPRLR